MRVICINEDAYPEGIESSDEDGIIKDGEVYEVVDVYMDEGYIFYVVSVDEDHGYWENCFARCSDIDEALEEVEQFETGKKEPMTFKKFLKSLI